MRAPAAIVVIPLLLGAGAGLAAADRPDDLLFACALGGAAIAWLAGVAFCADDRFVESAVAVACGCALTGFALGRDAAVRAYHPPLRTWFDANRDDGGRAVLVEGVLREDAAAGALGVMMIVDVEAVGNAGGQPSLTRAPGGVRLSVGGALALPRLGGWRRGRRIRASVFLREPTVYKNPGVPDDRRALARRGIILVGSVKSGALVEVVAPGSAADEAAGTCRAWARKRLAELIGRWSARSGAVATAILVGDRSGLPPADEQRLQEAGTYHVIAISGGNIAMLTLLLLGALRAFGLPPRAAAVATILLLIFYSRITGPAPSVNRAVTAAVACLAGRLLDQRGPALNVLAVAGGFAIAAAPVALFDPGFILSFGATLGIILLVPRVVAALRSRPLAVRLVAGSLAMTVAAEIALAPAAAALFSRVTFAGLLLNFAAVPLMTVVQAASIAALALGAVHDSAGWAAGSVAHLAATALVESARLTDAVPWLSVIVSPPAWWLVIFYYACAAAALGAPRIARPSCALLAVTGVVMLAGAETTSRDAVAPPRREWLRVVVLDVGQGDATLVRLPDGRGLLVDAGGLAAGVPAEPADDAPVGFDVGGRVVGPALRALGIRRLDTFVLSHADPDHIGGARAVLRAFGARAIWDGVPVPRHAARQALISSAQSIGAEWRTVVAGDEVRVAGVTIRALHPPRPDWERQRVRNDDSIVLDIRFGGVSLIVPGDVGREGEHALLQLFEPAPLVVLKAAHHGSATSSTPELLAALHPNVAIFSAGRANRFGHPAPVVTDRYRSLETTLFSTAEDGAVFVDTDGRIVEVWGWTGRRVRMNVSRRQD